MNEDSHFRALLAAAEQGSEEAACRLLLQYGPPVIAAVRRMMAPEMRSRFDSSDFAQAVWASLFANRSQLGRFETPAELMRFLRSTARNKVIDEFRRRVVYQGQNYSREKPLPKAGRGEDRPPESVQSTASQEAVANELWERITAGLPRPKLAILELRRLGFCNREIAERLGVSERSVQRVIRRVFEDHQA